MAGRLHEHGSTSIRIAAAGDEALLVEFGSVISRPLNRKVHGLAARLEAVSDVADNEVFPPGWLIELVPGYSSLLVRYDPDVIRYPQLAAAIQRMARSGAATDRDESRLIEIPVRYGGEEGPDLSFVAERTGMDLQEVIRLHSEPTYVVYMLGFMPGFCYLGELHPSLALPRRATPRLRIPPGAVAIGGAQTGIYPLESPGGWHWIGRTNVVMWDPHREPPALLRAGDEVRFVPL